MRTTDRERLEHLCRYLLRPPLASDRLEALPDGDLLLRLKTRRSDRTTHLRLTPQELLGRLAALIPRPRVNLLLYHSVLGARVRWRSRVVPAASPSGATPATAAPTSRTNHSWAELMRRGLDIDIDSLECPHQCGEGRLRFIATIERPPVARAILSHLGLNEPRHRLGHLRLADGAVRAPVRPQRASRRARVRRKWHNPTVVESTFIRRSPSSPARSGWPPTSPKNAMSTYEAAFMRTTRRPTTR